jgi:hypothetical protein
MNLLWFVLNIKEAEVIIKLIGELNSSQMKDCGLSNEETMEIFNIYSKWHNQKEQYYKVLEESDSTDKQLLDWFIDKGWWIKNDTITNNYFSNLSDILFRKVFL